MKFKGGPDEFGKRGDLNLRVDLEFKGGGAPTPIDAMK